MSARDYVLRVTMPHYFEAGDHRGCGITADASRAEPTKPPSETAGTSPAKAHENACVC